MLKAGTTLGKGALLGNRAASEANTAYETGIWMGAPAKFLYQPTATTSMANQEDVDPYRLRLEWLPIWLVMSLAESVILPLCMPHDPWHIRHDLWHLRHNPRWMDMDMDMRDRT